jgi:hypothetical protein
VWHGLWSLAALVAVLASWFAALVEGDVPAALHRFLAAYVRYTTHVWAYVTLVGRRFPGFVGRDGSYGVDAIVDRPHRQSRASIAFRLVLAIPALLVTAVLTALLLVLGLAGWAVALVWGRIPQPLRDVGAWCLRYAAGTLAYVLLLTDHSPLVRR